MLATAALFLGLLCSGISFGSAYTFLFAFNPAHSTPAFWVMRVQHAVAHAGVALFVVQPIAFACSVGLAVLHRDAGPAFWCSALASGAMFSGALVTRLGNIPINVAMRSWNPDALTAEHLAAIRRWWVFHLVRSVALFVGFGALILSATF